MATTPLVTVFPHQVVPEAIGTLNDYQALASRTLKEVEKTRVLVAETGVDELQLEHAALGVGTEAGELLDIIKRFLFYGKAVDPVHAAEELGDALWYVAAGATALGMTLDQIATLNIAKLRTRYPNGFTEADALARVDQQNGTSGTAGHVGQDGTATA